mmetsp:Transcript_4669/g.10486  ORF Transcript_4669/g.10486 Transcript_4669/m.10486 type:complete len:216 (-) Transcript_4669:393-1040(-)
MEATIPGGSPPLSPRASPRRAQTPIRSGTRTRTGQERLTCPTRAEMARADRGSAGVGTDDDALLYVDSTWIRLGPAVPAPASAGIDTPATCTDAAQVSSLVLHAPSASLYRSKQRVASLTSITFYTIRHSTEANEQKPQRLAFLFFPSGAPFFSGGPWDPWGRFFSACRLPWLGPRGRPTRFSYRFIISSLLTLLPSCFSGLLLFLILRSSSLCS